MTQFNALKDESAGFIVSFVDPQPGEDIIECCAAPGGKTLYMASHLHGQGIGEVSFSAEPRSNSNVTAPP